MAQMTRACVDGDRLHDAFFFRKPLAARTPANLRIRVAKVSRFFFGCFAGIGWGIEEVRAYPAHLGRALAGRGPATYHQHSVVAPLGALFSSFLFSVVTLGRPEAFRSAIIQRQ